MKFRKGTINVTSYSSGVQELKMRTSVGKVDAVIIIGRGKGISSDVILECVKNAIPVIICSGGGKIISYVVPPCGRNPEVRKRQYSMSEEEKARIAREMIKGKIRGQRYFIYDLLRAKYIEGGRDALRKMQEMVLTLDNTLDLMEIRDIEAKAASIYWGVLSKVWGKYGFDRRRTKYERPEDPVNSALNFMYILLSGLAASAILSTSLDIYCGILHEYSPKRPALIYDIIEEFRPVIDRAVNAAMKENNRDSVKIWSKHFSIAIKKVYTIKGYRRAVIGHLFEQAKKLERAILNKSKYEAFVVKA